MACSGRGRPDERYVVSESPYSQLSPAGLQTLKAQSMAAAEMIDRAEEDLQERLRALREMRKEVGRSLEELDARLGVQPAVEPDPLEPILLRAATDDALRKKLLEKPDETLRDLGVDTPRGVKVAFVEDSPKLRHHVIPTPQDARRARATTRPGGQQMAGPEGVQMEEPTRARPRRRTTR